MIAVYYQVEQRVEEYQYDAGGNRKQETITLRSSTTRDYSYYPNSNKLMTNGKFAFVYDDNGNLIKKGSNFILAGNTVTFDPEGKDLWIYEYDLLNRLTKVNQDGKVVAEYLYDEAGLRLKKQSQDATIYYVFDQNGQVLYEEENGEYLEYIYVLGKHFARVDGSLQSEEQQTYFYHTDHLGSTVLVTDESGESVWSTEYTPFGGMASTEGELKKAAKFTGKDLDEDIGLYYFNARWYDQEIGRFISEDSWKGNIINPRTLNCYIYTFNNPLKYNDPTGHIPQSYKINDGQRYLYFNTGRGMDLYQRLVGAIPIVGGFVFSDIKRKELSYAFEKENILTKTEGARNVLSRMTDFASQLQKVPYKTAVGDKMLQKGISTFGNISGYANLALTGISIGELAIDRGYISDQLVDKIAGYHLQSSTHEGLEMKYSYAKYRVEQLISEGELTYELGLFGMGNVTDYILDQDIKDQLVLELAIFSAFMVNDGLENEDMFNVAFPTSELGKETKNWIYENIIDADSDDKHKNEN